ncbi:Sec23-binding domain of Sec16-domain-containing protein [Morchella snyderi]|nr:Sec23-binding domain of Sec16-domain-containing protein [Morchella snyderi]
METKNDSLFSAFATTAEESEDDFFGKIGQNPQPVTSQPPPAGEHEDEDDDLVARWKAALAGDVLDDEEGFLPSDDEGFLPDSDDEKAMALSTGNSALVQTPSPVPSTAAGRYAPQIAQPPAQKVYGMAEWQPQVPQSQQSLPNPYSPHPSVTTSTTQGYSASSPYNSFGQPPKVPEPPKAQSFVNKKEGYQSPYDLPMDVVPQIIRKRSSNFGQAALGPGGLPPPSRSTSMGSAFSPATAAGPPKPKPQPQQFFEELPLPPTYRATSAMGYSSTQMLPRSAEGFVPPTGPQRSGSTQGFYSQSPQKQFAHSAVPSPQQVQVQPASAVNSRYSPAPRGTGVYVAPPASAPAAQGYQPPPAPVPGPNANIPYASPSAPPASSKYPPRPAGPPQATSAAPSLQPSIRQQVTVPLQTSIPQPPGHDDMQPPALRRFPSDHHVMHSSRPGTARSISLSTTMDIPREEEEIVEDAPNAAENSASPVAVPTIPNSRYAPPRGPGTPTPGQASRSSTFSPPSGSPRYIAGSPVDAFSPPPRAQTQSPGMAFGRSHKTAQRSREPYERPSSAFAHTSTHSHSSLNLHQRAQSLEVNFMAPTDETGRDMLKRWQGAPLFCWGFGGNVAVMFPRRAQRYSSDGLQPMIKCSPGEVKVKNIRDILPLKEIEGKFPGPAWNGSKNKGKKKEMLPWMTSRVEALESELGGQGKRAEEKILLWKVVRLLLEYDGVLEGNSEVEKAVRVVLTPEVLTEEGSDASVGYGSFTMVGDISANMQGPSADRVDPEAVRSIKTNLLKGDRTAAVWHAADKRLWSHALLIAGTVGKDLWKQVVQEFVKHEVKTLGEGVESLAVLYEIFAGNWAESVDELVSASTRIGVPMYGGVPNGADDVEDKLDRWRETLGLVLNNRSPGDSEAILALGRLLVSYGRIEAGHICYIFARQGAMGGVGAIFGGHDDPVSHFSLLGVDPANFTPNDVDAVMLSEVYELALALTATPHPAFPHLLPYKLQRAMVRAENGNKSEAQKYVDAIEAVMRSWGKPSPYFNAGFIARFEDMKTRLSIAPKDNTPGNTTSGAGKWLPKLNSETVTTSIWEHFHTFVNGEKDGDGNGTEPSGTEPTAGPFGRISSESPVISRVQSSADIYGGYNPAPNYGASPPAPTNGFQQQPYQPTAPLSGTGSKYAPQSRGSLDNPSNSYTPMSNHQYKSSIDLPATGYEPSSLNGNPGGYGGYGEGYGGAYEPSVPSGNPYGSGGYSQPGLQENNPSNSPQETSYSTTGYGNSNTYNHMSSFDEQTPTVPTASYDSPAVPETPSYRGYEPPSSGGYNPPSGGGHEPLSSGGYEPPSDGFIPFEPVKTDDDENHDKPKPKKKSFMDDDDDDELLKQAEKMKQEEAKKKAEEEKKQAADSSAKKGWLTGWFGGKKEQNTQGPIKAKLGDESSFVYDPDLKRWVNKKAGEQTPTAAKAAPPPKRTSTPGSTGMPSRPGSAAPPLSPQVPTPAMTPISPTPTTAPTTPTALSAPPAPFGRTPSPAMSTGQASPSLSSPPLTGGPQIGGPPAGGPPTRGPPVGGGSLTGGPPGRPPSGKPPGAGPPSRPATSMSVRGGDAMDDLLGPPGANLSRKSTPGVGRKARGKNRYVEVIPGQQ